MAVNHFVTLRHKAAASLCNDWPPAIPAVCSAADSIVSDILGDILTLGCPCRYKMHMYITPSEQSLPLQSDCRVHINITAIVHLLWLYLEN